MCKNLIGISQTYHIPQPSINIYLHFDNNTNVNINWGDGTSQDVIENYSIVHKHFKEPGTYTVKWIGVTNWFANCSGNQLITDVAGIYGRGEALSKHLTSLARTWYVCEGLTSFDTNILSSLVNLTSLLRTWEFCTNLNSFDTTPMKNLTKLINLSETWGYCKRLEYLDFNNIPYKNIKNIKGVEEMCVDCYNLQNQEDYAQFKNKTQLL